MKNTAPLILFLLVAWICPAPFALDNIDIVIVESCPDLEASLTGPTVAEPGQLIGNLMTAAVTNRGGVYASAFTTGFYITTEASFSSRDFPLMNGLKTEPGLFATNTVFPDISNLQVPQGIPSGDYRLLMIVDNGDEVEECDESNNIASIPIRIKGAACDVSDLRLTVDSIDYEHRAEEIHTRILLTVHNDGQAEAGTFSVAAFLSGDETVDVFDYYIPESRRDISGLGSEESATLLLESTFTPPVDISGTSFLGFKVDEFDEVFECNEFNNTGTAPLCSEPLITDDLRLILPRVTFQSVDESILFSIEVEMTLVPWETAAAFELTHANPVPAEPNTPCGQIVFTPEGTMHIPRIRFTETGIVTLSADLRYVAHTDRVLFEIVKLEILNGFENR